MADIRCPASVSVSFTSRKDLADDLLAAAISRGLEAVGLTAQRHAAKHLREWMRNNQLAAQENGVVLYRTGRLQNSIAHRVGDGEVVVGTNVDYAKYVEYGTGIHASDGNGRKTPWAYTGADGQVHWTRGIKPAHFLKRAIEEHVPEYRQLLEQSLSALGE